MLSLITDGVQQYLSPETLEHLQDKLRKPAIHSSRLPQW